MALQQVNNNYSNRNLNRFTSGSNNLRIRRSKLILDTTELLCGGMDATSTSDMYLECFQLSSLKNTETKDRNLEKKK